MPMRGGNLFQGFIKNRRTQHMAKQTESAIVLLKQDFIAKRLLKPWPPQDFGDQYASCGICPLESLEFPEQFDAAKQHSDVNLRDERSHFLFRCVADLRYPIVDAVNEERQAKWPGYIPHGMNRRLADVTGPNCHRGKAASLLTISTVRAAFPVLRRVHTPRTEMLCRLLLCCPPYGVHPRLDTCRASCVSRTELSSPSGAGRTGTGEKFPFPPSSVQKPCLWRC